MSTFDKLTKLGEGISRIAYLLKNGKVIKVPHWNGAYATQFEKYIYEMAPDHLKKFFPSPRFIKDDLVICDYVESADFIMYREDLDEISIPYFVEKYTTSSVDEVKELFDYFEIMNVCLDEFYLIADNFGRKNNEFCIIDWGEEN